MSIFVDVRVEGFRILFGFGRALTQASVTGQTNTFWLVRVWGSPPNGMSLPQASQSSELSDLGNCQNANFSDGLLNAKLSQSVGIFGEPPSGQFH